MDDDQQFCLRWNNHQSTLISVFDTLLENGTLVDCTLAAEGKFLKAHKVVLSACSPYFAALLSQQYDKHPIFILKDVKFQELRAMMDYMYRGEVNISQDQLAALLKAAESLQIKGLSDSRGSTSSQKSEATTSKTLQPQVPVNKASGLTIENKRPLKALGTDILDTDISVSREGSTSPTSRKRKKIRRKSLESNNLLDNHDQHSNSSSQSMHINTVTSLANQSSTSTTVANTNNNATSLSVPSNNVANIKKTENIHQHQQQSDALKHQIKQQQQPDDDDDDDDGNDEDDENINDSDMENEDESQSIKHKDIKSLTQSELMIEPKNEYDDGNDENVEDLTLDDEELLEDMEQPGPSHGGEGSSQGYAQWQMDRAPDEAFMGQEGGGQHRDAQESYSMLHSLLSEPENFKYPSTVYQNESTTNNKNGQDSPAQCPNCKRIYANKDKVRQHIKKYCLKEKKYQCMFCQYRSKRKDHIIRHTDRVHPTQISEKLNLGLIKNITEAFLQLDNSENAVQMGDPSEFLNIQFSESDYNGGLTLNDSDDLDDDN